MRSIRYIYIISSFLITIPLCAQNVTINPAVQYQTIEHFGASDAWRTQFVGANWPLDKREYIADLLFSKELDKQGNPKGIGLSLWRFYLGSGSTHQGDSSDIENEWRRAECFLQPDNTYDWNKQAGQQWFLEAAKKRGVEKYLAFTLCPPIQYSINGKAYSINGDERMNLKPGHYDEYAKFTVDVLQYFKNEGYEFDYLSPVNEPQWDWSKSSQEGSAATNEDIFLFTSYLSKELESRGMDTEIVVAESGEINHLYQSYKSSGDQISVFFDSSSPLNISTLPNVKSTISGHSYFTTWPIESQIEKREKLRASLDKVKGLGYWQSEFCILEKSLEIGSGHKRDLGMNTALYVARVIHSDLTIANASSWQWWTALTTYDFKDGLIYLDTGDKNDLFNRDRMKENGKVRESKLLWTLGNFSRFITPGMRRIEAAIDDQNVSIAAFLKNERVTLVMINFSQTQKKITLPGNIIVESAYVTDETRSLDKVDIVRESTTLPGRSVITLVGKMK